MKALNWAKSLGGLDALIARADANAATLANWVETTPALDFLAKSPATRSNASVRLKSPILKSRRCRRTSAPRSSISR